MRAKYGYDVPPVRLYLQADPVGMGGGAGLYSYGANEPTNQTDALGLLSVRARRYGTGAVGPGCEWSVSFNFLTRFEVSKDAASLVWQLMTGLIPTSGRKLPKYRHLKDTVTIVMTDMELLRRLGSTEMREEGFDDWHREASPFVQSLTAIAASLADPLMTYDIPRMIEDAKAKAKQEWWKDPWGHLCCD